MFLVDVQAIPAQKLLKEKDTPQFH